MAGKVIIDSEWNIRDRWWEVVVSDDEYVKEYRCKGTPENNASLEPKLQAFQEDFEMWRYDWDREDSDEVDQA